MVAVLAVCLGACVGALLRWRISEWLNPIGPWWPWGTLVANLIGGYLVGVALAVLENNPQLDPTWRLLIVTGFLGALTTFSSFSAEVVEMLMHQRYLHAVGTVALHLGGSLLLTVAGLKSAMWFMAQRVA